MVDQLLKYKSKSVLALRSALKWFSGRTNGDAVCPLSGQKMLGGLLRPCLSTGISTTYYELKHSMLWRPIEPFSTLWQMTIFSNSTIDYSVYKPYDKLKLFKSYESSFPNESLSHSDHHHDHGKYGELSGSEGSLRVPRSREAKLGDIKHHVFILKLYNKRIMQYRAYCAGSIISEQRVLTSAQCFYTNRKRLRHVLNNIKLAGGLLQTVHNMKDGTLPAEQQWRSPSHVYTQKFYRFPAYSLAVVQVDKPWVFNDHVNKIPFAKSTLDYDGVCVGTVVKITKSWAYKKYLFTEHHKIIPRDKCERSLLRTCRLYICTISEGVSAESETAGGGLVCFDTGTEEEDATAGLLVGVTVLINIGLPSLHHRIAMFQKWVTDDTTHPKILEILILACLWFIKFLR